MPKLRGCTIYWGGLEDMFLCFGKHSVCKFQITENCYRVKLQYAQGKTTSKIIPRLEV